MSIEFEVGKLYVAKEWFNCYSVNYFGDRYWEQPRKTHTIKEKDVLLFLGFMYSRPFFLFENKILVRNGFYQFLVKHD